MPLLALLFASALLTRLSPEQPVAALTPSPPEGQQFLGATATNGHDFLVAWSGATGLYASRVSREGKNIGQPISLSASANATEISACWTGSQYLITWGELGTINAAAISAEGTIVKPAYRVVDHATARSGSLASVGRRSLMMYGTGPGPTVKAALFDADGGIVTMDVPLPLNDIGSVEIVPRVATDGGEFLLVWRSGERVPIQTNDAAATPPPLTETFHTFHALRVSELGTPIGAPITIARTEQTTDFSVAFGGGVYAITAVEIHLIKPAQTQARIVRFIVDPYRSVATALPKVDAAANKTAVVWTGSRFLASWMTYTSSAFTLMTMAFSGGAEVSPPTPETALTGAHFSSDALLAWNGATLLAAWSEDIFDTRGAESAIRGVTFDPGGGQHQPPFLISVTGSRQFSPAIATSGSDTLMVWIESQDPSRGRLVGVRLGADGAPIDATPFEIAAVASVAEAPRVTFSGEVYLVAWREDTPRTSIIAARSVGRDGSLGPRTPLGLGGGLSVASNLRSTIVVFGGQQVFASRFDPRGEPIDTAPILIGSGFLPKAASNGTDFFITWNVGSDYWQFPSPGLIDVVGARLTTSGSVDAAPIAIATGPADQFVEGVGSDGRDYTVFVSLGLRGSPNTVLVAKRILREGQLASGSAQDDGTIVGPNLDNLSVTASTGGFWIAGLTPDYYAGTITLVRTDTAGNASESVVLASFNSPGMLWPASVALAQVPGAPLQIAYARRLDEPAKTSRAFFRNLTQDGGHRSRVIK